jgi:hypothetical protein
VNQVDNLDIPLDGNICTDDLCQNGVPSHPNQPVNTPCGPGGLCDGNGNCGSCNVDSDCPADTFCRDYSCDTGQNPHLCVFTNINEGVDLPTQAPGDCHTQRCSAGLPVNQIDNSDLPVDMLECTDDVCQNGVPSNPNRPLNTPCTQNSGRFCDGNGACRDCNSAAQCTLGDGICESDACQNNTCVIVPHPVTMNAPPSCQSPMPDCQVVKCNGTGECGASVPDNLDIVSDNNECTQDTCSGGNPVHNPTPLNNMPCTPNALFCDGPERCQAGACVPSGNPCSGHNVGPACNDSCNEAADNCTAPDALATPCQDGVFCNGADACNALGSCVASNVNPCPGTNVGPLCNDSCRELGSGNGNCTGPDTATTTCSDGLFCTGTELCNGTGTCTSSGNPCPGPDGDAQCSESCSEANDNCLSPDPNGSDCGGGDVCIAATCSDVRLVFVTSTLYDGNDLGSAAAADAACAARAAAVGLSGTFFAWMSDGATSPALDFTAATVPYVLLDGSQIAANFTALTSGSVAHAINVNEAGSVVATTSVWTGTLPNGTPGGSHCQNWTSAAAVDSGVVGSSAATNGSWTNSATAACNVALPIYCFEQ